MTDPHTVAGTATSAGRRPAAIPVDQVDDERLETDDAPAMTDATDPGAPDHHDVPDIEENKGIALRFIKGVFIDQDPAAVDELTAEDFTPHTFGDMPPGREPLKEAMRRAGEGVSEPTFEIHDVIAEKDRVAVRLTTEARHTGTFMGMPATGNRYSIDEIHIFRVRDGKVLEHWHEFDKLALLEQLKPRTDAGT
jgi:steroid delta-isomerase-like uncharacterized protein